MICDLIQDLLKYLKFSEPSKFGVLKLRKCEYSIEYFISRKGNILEYSNIVLFNTSLAVKGALANRLQRRTACKIQNGRQGAPKWQRGSGKVSTPRFLGVPVNFR